jgi:alkanesulfonate monooxygenase SsuD/methylene tetrahydromethanopterin reductase-like flavin-dependent oxidoreductase (luciferase family)
MELGQLAETLGYDSLWVADHLMLGRNHEIMEGWTTLAALAGATRRARLGMIHQAHFFRNPALAAKMGATLDQISDGRFIYFIDGGYGRQEHLSYNFTWFDDVGERFDHVLDGLQITLALWQTEEPVTLSTTHFQVNEAISTPLPVQKPHPPIWFGEAHPKIVEATARMAQGWNTVPASPADLDRKLAALTAACQAVGRNPDEIEKSLETQILIAPDRATLRRQLRQMIELDPGAVELKADVRAFVEGSTDDLPASLTEPFLVGTPDEVAERIQLYIDRGISHFLFWFMDAPDEAGLRLFAEAVAPRFRQTNTPAEDNIYVVK